MEYFTRNEEVCSNRRRFQSPSLPDLFVKDVATLTGGGVELGVRPLPRREIQTAIASPALFSCLRDGQRRQEEGRGMIHQDRGRADALGCGDDRDRFGCRAVATGVIVGELGQLLLSFGQLR